MSKWLSLFLSILILNSLFHINGCDLNQTYQINGKIAYNGVSIQNVKVKISGDATGTALTNSSGIYSFSGLKAGNYMLTPVGVGYIFEPAIKNVIISSSNPTNIDFNATSTSDFFVPNDYGDLIPLQESICGITTDWQDVDQYDGTLGPTQNFVAVHKSPVARLEIPVFGGGTALCTGTLISPNLFLTAGHCIDDYDPNGGAIIARFNFQVFADGTDRTSHTYSVSQIIEDRTSGLDYAILQLSDDPGLDYGFATVDDRWPRGNELLTIIQHPFGIEKVVEAGNYAGNNGAYMQYTDLDTMGGSSGSGVLDEDGNLVAVHTNGGCNSTGGTNRGLSIVTIAQVSNTIQGMIDNNEDICHCKPVAQYWNGKDHSYLDIFEVEGMFGYVLEGYAFSLCKDNPLNTGGLYRYWNGTDHFYTTIYSPGGALGYQFEDLLGYIFLENQADILPLHRYYNGIDHSYLLSYFPDGIYGYQYEEIAGYAIDQR